MLPDLQHLIHLQEIDSAIDRAGRRIFEIPTLQQALESRAAAHAAAVQAVKDRMTTTAATRREIEKDVAAVQSRLSKYKDQLMAVKTRPVEEVPFTAPAQTLSAPGETDATTLAVITAAAVAAVGRPVRVQRITFINHNTISAWAERGRVSIQGSHNIRRPL